MRAARYRSTAIIPSLAAITLLTLTTALPAQNAPAGPPPTQQKKPEENTTAAPPTPTPGGNRRREKNRLWFQLGAGRAEVRAAILSETPNAWLINSAVEAGRNSSYPVSVPILNEEKPLAMPALTVSGEYAYIDRYFVGFNLRWIRYQTPRESPSKAVFLSAGNSTLQPSIYEGLRLVTYKESRVNFHFTYLRPAFLAGLKLGGFIEREKYIEDNDLSLGSLTATRSGATPPSTLIWASAAVTPARYDMSGWLLGAAARYQIFDWLGVTYRLAPFYSRKGSLSMSGIQTLNETGNTGASSFAPMVPFAVAEVKDSGIRHNLEATMRFNCIYTFSLGILREDLKRSYSSYFGYTATTGRFYFAKTPTGIGLGETSSSHKLSTAEIYFRFGVLGFF